MAVTSAPEDHAYTWAPAYARLGAIRRTRNADSYRAYLAIRGASKEDPLVGDTRKRVPQ